jgi:trigger factor
VKIRLLPAVDEAFAKSFGAENLERLREGVRSDLQNERNLTIKRSIRSQIVRALLDAVTFDLPESTLQQETRNVVYDIVADQQKRGASKDAIDKAKDEIYAIAGQSARERLKIGFLVKRIADKEGIRASEQDINLRLIALAQSYQVPVDKFVKDVQEKDGLPEIYQQLIHEKVMDFLHENARIEDVVAAPAAASEPAAPVS